MRRKIQQTLRKRRTRKKMNNILNVLSKKKILSFILCLLVFLVLGLTVIRTAGAESSIKLDINSGEAEQGSSTLDLLFMLAFLALIPTFLMMMTCFTRLVVSFSFLRNAMGTQNSPPNQVIIGLSIFISIFVMLPVFQEIKTTAYDPYKAGTMQVDEAITEGSKPLKVFMLKQVYDKDLDLFISLAEEKGTVDASKYDSQEKLADLSLFIITPAFITSELKRAFLIGFLLYIPFLIIDLVVSSTLMAMGMVMLPPAMISMPFKLMLFVVADGWDLLIKSLIVSFN